MNMCMLCDGDQVLALDKAGSSYNGTTFPGGHVEAGETFSEAVIREMKEETGLVLLMLQRHFSGLKNIRTGKEPRKDLMKGLRKEKTGDR